MEQLQFENNNGGYVALLGVLVLGAAGLAIALAVILSGTDSLITAGVIEKSAKTKALTDACAEKALQEIRNSTNFEGSGSLSIDSGSCDYNVIAGSAQNRTIESVGTLDDIVRKVKIEIDSINPDINIISWQEVADL